MSGGNSILNLTYKLPLSDDRLYCGIPSLTMHFTAPGFITSPAG